MPSPTYDHTGAKPGCSPIYPPDVEWLKKELAKYDPKEPKIVVNHYNAGSIDNREELDAIYKANNVRCTSAATGRKCSTGSSARPTGDGRWASREGGDVLGGPSRPRLIGIAHWEVHKSTWVDATIVKKVAPRCSVRDQNRIDAPTNSPPIERRKLGSASKPDGPEVAIPASIRAPLHVRPALTKAWNSGDPNPNPPDNSPAAKSETAGTNFGIGRPHCR
jgi:hypothetical protein